MVEEKGNIHVYIQRDVHFKKSLSMSIKVIVPYAYGIQEVDAIVSNAVATAKEWKGSGEAQ